jgi:hypothetical protein
MGVSRYDPIASILLVTWKRVDGTVRFDFVDATHVRLRLDSGAPAPTQMPRA